MATYEKPETNFEERGDTNTNEKDYFEEKNNSQDGRGDASYD